MQNRIRILLDLDPQFTAYTYIQPTLEGDVFTVMCKSLFDFLYMWEKRCLYRAIRFTLENKLKSFLKSFGHFMSQNPEYGKMGHS